MDDKIFKIIPFEEVKVGQEFEDVNYESSIKIDSWIKINSISYAIEGQIDPFNDGMVYFTRGCLVRIADCEPVLDFDTWWKSEGEARFSYDDFDTRYLMNAAWDAAKAN